MMLGTVSYGTAVVLARGSSVIVALLLSRLVGPGDLGAVSYIMAAFIIANVFADIGVANSLPRLVPRESRPRPLVVHALSLRLVVSVCIALGIWFVDLAWGIFRGLGAQIAFLVACSTCSAAVVILDTSLRFVAASATRIAVGFGWIIGAIVFVKLGLPIWGPILAYGLSTLAVGLPICWSTIRGYREGFDPALFQKLVGFGLRAVGVLALTAVVAQIGLLILAYARGDEAAGLYRVALSIASPPLLLAAAVGDPFSLLVARADASDEPNAPRLLIGQVLVLLVTTAGVIVPFCILLGPDVLRIVAPSDYSSATSLLSVLVVASALGMLNAVAGSALYSLGQLRVLLRASAVAALTAAVGSWLLLVPLGDLGAAAGLALANALLALLLANWFRTYLRGWLNYRALTRAMAFAAVTLVVAVLMTTGGLPERVLVLLLCLAVYGALMFPLLRPHGVPRGGTALARWMVASVREGLVRSSSENEPRMSQPLGRPDQP